MRHDATWRDIGDKLAGELHAELFHVPLRLRHEVDPQTGGHLYQAWYMRYRSTLQERSPVIIRIEQLIYYMLKLGYTHQVGREITRWNREHAPDPVIDKARRIVLETTLYGDEDEPQAEGYSRRRQGNRTKVAG